jgi:hypothetical protein
MTPKEKAEELIDKIYFSRRYDDTENYIPQRAYEHAKQCALIAVDELISSHNKWDDYAQTNSEEYYYWQEVKQEIEKL